jgi:hypothetical protein
VSTRRIVCVGDTHVGSDFALWTKIIRKSSGTPRLPSEVQSRLLAYWSQFWAWAKPYDSVILLGDICDGNNRREAGRNLTSVELLEQVEAAASLLSGPCKGKSVWGVSGSGYHQGLETDLDELVYERLGAESCGAILNLELKGTGKIMQARHNAGGAVIYRSGALDQESLFLDAAIGSGMLPFKVDALVFGHWHWYDSLDLQHRTVTAVPGWKLLFPFKGLSRYGKHIPSIGGVKLVVDQNGVQVSRKLFPYIPVIDKVRTA